MTQEAKIIGIVKELQAHFDAGVKSEEWQAFDDEIMNHFPKLAEAILIAVEALEKIDPKDVSGYASWQDLAESHEFTARNALSKISSL